MDQQVKPPLRTLPTQLTMPGSSSVAVPPIWFPADGCSESSRWWAGHWCPGAAVEAYMGPRFLASIWHSCDCYRHLRSKPADRKYLCVCVAVLFKKILSIFIEEKWQV